MRTPSSALSFIALAGLGAAIVVGCATSDTPEIGDDVDSGATGPGIVEAPTDTGDSGPSIGEGDAAVPPKDAAADDASVDAGPQPIPPPVKGAIWPAPKEGDTCTKVDEQAYDWCGKCGNKSAICQKQPDGSLKWSAYSFCDAEVGECDPSLPPEQEECGSCGTLTKSCSQYGTSARSCSYSKTACANEKTCSPGSVEYTSAGCQTKGTFKYRYCNATGPMKCEYEPNFGATCDATPVTFDLPIPLAETQIVTAIVNLTEGATNQYLTSNITEKFHSGTPSYYTCESTTTEKKYPYLFTKLENKTGKTATISVFTDNKLPANYPKTKLDGVKIAVYKVMPNMATDAGRFGDGACSDDGYSSYCSSVSDLPCKGKSGMAAIYTTSTANKNIVIAPGASVYLYVQSNYPIDNTSGKIATGNLVVGVRTDKLE